MKDIYCSYYTESDDITSYMARKLGIAEHDVILEPSVGEGIFIDEILKTKLPVKIDALDINEKAILALETQYADNSNITLRLTDTLFDEELDRYSMGDGYYDKIIGNPPYGAWQDYEKRALLKKKYVDHYVKETYTMFLLRCVSVLKMGGRLSFIIPDTFLFLNMHEKVRKMLLTCTRIEEILIFPSKFFPGVSFGYSNLSIITLEKCGREDALQNVVRIVKGFKTSAEFEDVVRGKYSKHLAVFDLKQSEILTTEKSRFIIAENQTVSMLEDTEVTLGQVADIVTGFYSGNNKKFVCAKNEAVKGAKNYPILDRNKLYDCTSLTGIADVAEGYIPYIKSSSKTRYRREEDEWFVRWDSKTIQFYHDDSKARFQNSRFYFQKGIAIPMVKSNEIRATIMENRVFDQSIVGIFPREEQKLYYLLALMNSDVINRLLHVINPTANNSSNYVKQLPYKEPNEEIREHIEANVAAILALDPISDVDRIAELHKQNNDMIEQTYA